MPDASRRVAYIVHDVNDAAVARRVAMLTMGGLKVSIIGFRRDARSPSEINGAPVTILGATHDGRLVRRLGSVLAAVARPGRLLTAAAGCDTVMARNLESLALAARVRRAVPQNRLVYECLDIHRTLLGTSVPARAVRAIEARLLRLIDLLIVSSPAFVREHFATRMPRTVPVLLVENKVLALSQLPPTGPAPDGPPWTIGWFGMLRCRRTFDILRKLAARLDGRVRVLIAGRPSPAEFDDFEQQVEAAPHCDYVGPYTMEILPALYARCHFAWAIDFFEEGLNSSWLLPNRLYEASIAHVVPIALRSVETGRWLAAHDAGLLLDNDDPVIQLGRLFETLQAEQYIRMRTAVAAIPQRDLIADVEDCRDLARRIVGV